MICLIDSLNQFIFMCFKIRLIERHKGMEESQAINRGIINKKK